MRNVAQSVATAPSDGDFEALERRLLELRAEIDAILTQLASQKAEPAAIETADAPEPQAMAAEPAPAEAPIAEAACEASPGAIEEVHTELERNAAIDASANAPLPEGALTQAEAGADLTPIASIDAQPAQRLDGSQDGDTISLAAAAETPETAAQTECESDVAQPDPVAASAEPTVAQETPAADHPADAAQQPRAEAQILPLIAQAPVTAGEATTAAATAQVISFEQRQRKQKAAATIGAPVRRGRKVATRIAASIIALIAAATALVVADQAAMGSAQPLPWISPLPSYMPSGASWPFLGQQKRADDSAAASVAPSVAAEALLLRYRQVWPVSP